MNLLAQVHHDYYRTKKISEFGVGDTIDVHLKIREGEKDRIQIFQGVVIKRKGGSLDQTFTVRRLVQGEGVERVFLLHSPRVVEIKIVKHGQVRRAKLYYLRGKVGKQTRIREAYEEHAPEAAKPAPAAPPPPPPAPTVAAGAETAKS